MPCAKQNASIEGSFSPSSVIRSIATFDPTVPRSTAALSEASTPEKTRDWVPMGTRLRAAKLLIQIFGKLVGDCALQSLCLVVGLVPWIAEQPDQKMFEKVMTTQDANGEVPSIFRQLDVFISLLPRKPKAFQSAQDLSDRGAAHPCPFSKPAVADVSVIPFQDVDAAEVFRCSGNFAWILAKSTFTSGKG